MIQRNELQQNRASRSALIRDKLPTYTYTLVPGVRVRLHCQCGMLEKLATLHTSSHVLQ
jgi:hypothetical protein